eukprot:PRCOL_00005175-RA
MVRGSYEYCHYLQDRFDDKGWGCAYRSLQTIASWFRRAHYTSAAPPDHAAIQRALVDVGDKPRSFVGSRQWETGDVAYLILDPHYTGADEVKPVHAGGWVGWKRGLDAKGGTGGLVFDKASFYNLLLPLRPKTV